MTPSRTLAALLLVMAPQAKADDGPSLFRDRVRAILTDSCMTCHDGTAKKGGLDISRRDAVLVGGDSGPAIEPGDPSASPLIDRVAAGDMPPKGEKLSAEQIATLKAWVAAGAPYEGGPLAPRRAGLDWWALRPIVRPEPPEVADPSLARNPIDAFVLDRLKREGLTPAPEADRPTLVRRLTFDLTGLPPTPEEVASFLADDAHDAYERFVDRLLASPRYGERWARHWLDAVRFGESHGYEMNTLRPNAWPYRDWAIRAFNEDIPFSRFVAEQFAGDALPDGDWLSRSATGFLVGGVHDMVGNATPEATKQQRVDDLDDMIAATGSAFLGLTVHCARCHDHKFDPIKQTDYYGLQAVFAGVEHAERLVAAPDVEVRRRRRGEIESELAALEGSRDQHEPLTISNADHVERGPVRYERNVERFSPVTARWVRMTITATADGAEPCIDEFEVYSAGEEARNVAIGGKASASSVFPDNPNHAVAHLNDGRTGNARSWISRESGGGSATIELAETTEISRVVWGRDRSGRFRDRLATAYRVEVATEQGTWTTVADSSDRRPFSRGDVEKPAVSADREEILRVELASLTDAIPVYAGTFRAPGPTHVLRRGDPMQPGPEVFPSGLSALAPRLTMDRDAPEPARRLALANWISDPANPIAARVVVNRAWHHLLGRGIVATPGDFGFNGDRPSHPELLDWLAREFLDNGGHMKPIHRLIVTSAAYRRSSRIDEAAMTKDRDDRWLWRMSPRRLEAEAIRDAMLSAAGTLDLRMGGPGYSIWEENTNYVVVFKPKSDLGPDANRRMVYQFKPRSQPDPTFGAFDCPDGALVAPRRNTSTTALQALNLLNSRFVMAQSQKMAERLAKEAGSDPAEQVALAFRLAFGREPTRAESEAGSALVREHGAAALCRSLYNANEFLYVR